MIRTALSVFAGALLAGLIIEITQSSVLLSQTAKVLIWLGSTIFVMGWLTLFDILDYRRCKARRKQQWQDQVVRELGQHTRAMQEAQQARIRG